MRRMNAHAAVAAVALCLAAVGDIPASHAGESAVRTVTPSRAGEAFTDAQSAAATEVVGAISWEDIKQFMGSHPELLAAASDVEAAAAAVKASRQYPNPVLGAGVARAEAFEDAAEDRIWDFELRVPILSPGVYRGGVRAAEAERDAVVHEAAGLRLEVVRRTKEIFWRIAHDQQRLETLERSRTQLTALVEVARQRVEMGEARPMELSRIEIEWARVDLEVAGAREAAQTRKQILNLWLGSRLPDDFRVHADISNLPDLPPMAEAMAAVARHPELNAAGRRVQAASARLAVERAARFPDISIGGFYREEPDYNSFGGAVEVAIPLWNWNSGRIAQASSAEARTRYYYDVTSAELKTAVRQSHASAAVAYAAAQSFQEVILPKAAQTAAALERMYQVGEVDVMNVLDARRGLIEIQSELLGAYLESQLAYLQLATLMGDNGNEQKVK